MCTCMLIAALFVAAKQETGKNILGESVGFPQVKPLECLFWQDFIARKKKSLIFWMHSSLSMLVKDLSDPLTEY